jgi:hypothetical protein
MSDTAANQALLPIIHPLDDLPEEKLFQVGLGRMRMTRTVRFALIALQAYLALMLILAGVQAVTLL